jgi:predicted phosphodiesterase
LNVSKGLFVISEIRFSTGLQGVKGKEIADYQCVIARLDRLDDRLDVTRRESMVSLLNLNQAKGVILMRTLILSDLHLGNGGDYDIFAGREYLPELLNQFVSPPTHVILNGDSMDFLLNEGPLQLDASQAVQQAESIATAEPTAPTLKALGRICAGGGDILVRMGNHDVELALAEVRDVFRNHLGQPNSIAEKMTFERGSEPHILSIGGVSILVTHGEQHDPINLVDYEHLPGPEAPASVQAIDFKYPPGSLLVKKLLNPLKKEYRMRFADLLKPDFQGAVLAALAVDPSAVSVALKEESLEIIRGALENLGDVTFVPGTDEIGLAYAFQQAALTAEEIEVLKQQLTGAPVSYDIISDLLYSLRLKLSRTGLKIYAHAHRQLVGTSGEKYFSYEPDASEMDEIRRLSEKYDARAVITGHSHSSRWKLEGNLLYVNTGTWIWLMRVPGTEATDDEWTDFLQDLKDDPKLESDKNQARLERRFTPVTIEPRAEGGATVSLHTWEPSGELRMVHSAAVSP